MAILINYKLGQLGVNTDASDLHMDNAEVREAQNIIPDPDGSVQNRPGLIKFNASSAAGSILGGIGVPLIDRRSGISYFFIGRGPD